MGHSVPIVKFINIVDMTIIMCENKQIIILAIKTKASKTTYKIIVIYVKEFYQILLLV